MAVGTFAAWLRGESEPKSSTLAAIVHHTGCDAHWLLTGEGVPFPQHERLAATFDELRASIAETLTQQSMGPDQLVAELVLKTPTTRLGAMVRSLLGVDGDNEAVRALVAGDALAGSANPFAGPLPAAPHTMKSTTPESARTDRDEDRGTT